MGTLSGDVVRHQLALLLRAIGLRRWKTPLALDDIAALISMRTRVSWEVAQAALAGGLLEQEAGVFRLTHLGFSEAQRHARGDGHAIMIANSESSITQRSADSEFGNHDSRSPKPQKSDTSRTGLSLRSKRGSRIPKGFVDPPSIGIRSRSRSDPDQIQIPDPDPDQSTASSRPRALARSKSLANDEVIESVRQVMAGVVSLPASADHARAISMAQTFVAAQRAYRAHRPGWEMGISPVKLRPGFPQWTHCLHAARHAESLGVDYETYVRAQFFWFDQWFSRAPRFWELTSVRGKYNALERVRAYQREVEAGRADPRRSPVGRQRVQPKISLAVRMQQGERTLRALMATHRATEEQILRTFAAGNQAALYFDSIWLKQNPTYCRLRAAGEL